MSPRFFWSMNRSSINSSYQIVIASFLAIIFFTISLLASSLVVSSMILTLMGIPSTTCPLVDAFMVVCFSMVPSHQYPPNSIRHQVSCSLLILLNALVDDSLHKDLYIFLFNGIILEHCNSICLPFSSWFNCINTKSFSMFFKNTTNFYSTCTSS